MTAYAFSKGTLVGDNGVTCEIHGVALDIAQANDGSDLLAITGVFSGVAINDAPPSGQIFFETSTSNFGVRKAVTIKLNNCLIEGSGFRAVPDKHGNVFTLSMAEDAA